jgi:hypothetical protein
MAEDQSTLAPVNFKLSNACCLELALQSMLKGAHICATCLSRYKILKPSTSCSYVTIADLVIIFYFDRPCINQIVQDTHLMCLHQLNLSDCNYTPPFFEMGSIAPASASIDAHSHFFAIFKVLAVHKSWITQSVHKYQPTE